MADIAIVSNNFACVTDVFSVMAAKTTGRVEMTDVVWVTRPIRFHLGEKVGFEDALRFTHRRANRTRFLGVELSVVGPVELV